MGTRWWRRTVARAGALLVLAALVVVPAVLVHEVGQPAVGAAAWRTGTTAHTLAVDGERRSFRVHRPAGLPAAAPLVVFLHPAFGSPAQSEADYHWNDVAARERIVVAYPTGVGASWNAGTCCGRAQQRGVDDVAFVSAMVAEIGRHVGIDERRVYVVGFSNGAFLAERLACDTGIFAAVAQVAGTRVTTSCAPPAARVPSVLYVHGLADTNVRWDGAPGTGRAQVDGEPRTATLAAWRAAIGDCPAPSVTSTTVGSTVVARSTSSCADGRAVAAVTLSDAGHQYPGAVDRPLQNRALGLPAPSRAIDATAEIWAFLAAHPR